MQNAKRMVLIDEKLLDNLWRKQDTTWKKPIDYKAKTLLNSQLKTDLDDTSLPEDERVKQYQRNLNRFLHTTRKHVESEPIPIMLPIPKVPRKRIKKRVASPVVQSPRIKREVKKTKQFPWSEWR
jgi:hypothetical protein